MHCRSMNLLNNGFQRQCGRLRHWDHDDSTSNEEGEVDDEDELRPREDESGDQDEDVEAKGSDDGTAERGHQRAKVGKSGQSHFTMFRTTERCLVGGGTPLTWPEVGYATYCQSQ